MALGGRSRLMAAPHIEETKSTPDNEQELNIIKEKIHANSVRINNIHRNLEKEIKNLDANLIKWKELSLQPYKLSIFDVTPASALSTFNLPAIRARNREHIDAVEKLEEFNRAEKSGGYVNKITVVAKQNIALLEAENKALIERMTSLIYVPPRIPTL